MVEIKFQYEGEPYTFNPGRMSVLEGIEMEKLTGLTYQDWAASLEQFKAESVRFLVWLALGRAGKRPDCKYREFDFDMLGVLSTFDVEGAEPDEESEPVDPTPRPRRRASTKT